MKTDNELIAEFMGLVKCEPNEVYNLAQFYKKNDQDRRKRSFIGYAHQLQYHSSWDWLMPVVDKISNLELPIEKFGKGRYYGQKVDFIIDFQEKMAGWLFWRKNIPGDQNQSQSYPKGDSMIEKTYKSVVEFIKWYNSINETK